MTRRGTLPQRMPAAFVLTLAESAEPSPIMTGGFRQRVTARLAVVLVVRDLHDARGDAAADQAETLAETVRLALAGWQPDGAETPLTYAATQLAGIEQGSVLLQLEFTTQRTLSGGTL